MNETLTSTVASTDTGLLEHHSAQEQQLSIVDRAWHFLLHFIEMCAAMCVGLMVLDGLFLGVARGLGITDPLRQFPELSTIVIAFNMAAPMVAWMRFQGMPWRPNLEMAAAMFVEAALLIGLAWFGVLPRSGLFAWQHTLMMPAMLVPMLLRLDLYTGGMHHGAHHGSHPA